MTVPFVVWNLLATTLAVLPNPPLSRDQIELMRRDNLPNPELPGFAELGITPRDLAAELEVRLTAPVE